VVQVAIVDDFESYTDNMDEEEAIFQTWIDGIDNNNGSIVGYMEAPFAERIIVRGGEQSMPFFYDNGWAPYYSEAERTWDTPQDWTTGEADMLTLCFLGMPDNSPLPFYVAVEDSAGHVAVVPHPDPGAVLVTEWQRWLVPFADFPGLGVDMASVKKLILGIGNRDNPQLGGYGIIYIDDITLANGMP
jgi:hypothetical protein